jgi:hypothetical protein
MASVWLAPQRSEAQAADAGTVAGNVLDAQGGFVINATAILTSTTQGTSQTVNVNARGEYVFSSVTPGTYSLTVTAPTFEKYVAQSITVNAGENIRQDAGLTRGMSSDTVTVEAPSTTVDTRSATIATVIDPNLVNGLPVDGNNVVALAALLPGVTNVNAPTTFTGDTGGPTYNVSGARNNQNLFLLDGLLWNNVYYNTGLNFPPPFILQEVSVQLNNFKAQYGRNVGSIFNAITRSGSNTIHGTVWEYIQNTALNAADYIYQRNPHLVQNQFGATIGGPILKDKLFYLLGYQGLLGTAEVDTKSQTPTLAERGLQAPGIPLPCITPSYAGMSCANFSSDFTSPASQALIAAGTGGVRSPIYATSSYLSSAITEINSTYTAQGGTGTSPCITALTAAMALTNVPGFPKPAEYLPNNEIPSVCFNPVSVNVLAKYVPYPNQINPSGGAPYTVTNTLQPRNEHDGFARFDYTHGRHTIGARTYTTQVADLTSNGAVVAAGTTPGISSYELDANSAGIRSGIVDDTWVLTPNILNVIRVGYKRYNYLTQPTDPTTLNNLGALGTLQQGHPSLPRFEADNRFQLGANNGAYSYSVNASYEADESVLWTHGNNTFQFGGQYLDLDYVHRFDEAPQLVANTQNTSISTADFLIGLPQMTTVGNTTNISAVDHAFYFYGQDDWRIMPRLTLNLGLRYELPLPWYQPDGQSVTFIPGYQSYRFPNTPSSLAFQNDPGVPNSIIKTKYGNLAPRFGFAYDLFGNGKTALRGGFGIFYDTLNANTVGIGEPYHYTATYTEPVGGFSQPLLGENQVPANYSGPASAQFVGPYTVNFADANATEPYTMAMNLGFQQHIAQATLEVNYVAKFGRHQIIPYDLNPAIFDCSGSYFQANPALYCPNLPNVQSTTATSTYAARAKYPGFGTGGQGIVDNNTVGTSNYNGLQVIYTQRSHKSLSTVVSYTYSRSLDDQSSGTTNVAALPLAPDVASNYGPSDFQATHVVNMGWIYKLPLVMTGPKVERAILNNWTFGGIFNARTGNPINPVLSGDRSLTDERPQRPVLNPGFSIKDAYPKGFRHRSAKVLEWFDPGTPSTAIDPNTGIEAAFEHALNPIPGYGCIDAASGHGCLNPISRNALYGPAFIETDFNLRRTVAIPYRGMEFEMRIEAFNVFNTPNLANPIISLSGSTTTAANLSAGQIVATVGKNGAVGTNGRRGQISLILHY